MRSKINEYNIFFEKQIDSQAFEEIKIDNSSSHETFFKMDEEIEKEIIEDNIIEEQEDFFDKMLE